MATTFKTFLNDDRVSTKTLLHEAIPVTGSLLYGTYPEPGLTNSNIKLYTHGMFQSVYDYTYTKSSANHIFDLTVGYASDTSLTVTADTYKTKKQMIYNEFAKILVGHDTVGAIRQFDEDGDLTTGDKYKECFVVSIARLLNKDEVKKGSFYMDIDVTGVMPPATCSIGGGDSATASRATLTFSTASPSVNETVILISTDGTSITYTAKAAPDFPNNQFDQSGAFAATATSLKGAIEHASGHNGKITVADNSSGVLTLTQATKGTSGDKAIVETLTNVVAAGVAPTTANTFTGGDNGTRSELRISDTGAGTAYKTNSPTGEYGILKCDTYKVLPMDPDCVDEAATCTITYAPDPGGPLDNLERSVGLIFYQAGVAVLSPYMFETYLKTDANGGYDTDGTKDGKLPIGHSSACNAARPLMDAGNRTIDTLLNSQSLDDCGTAFRKRINKIAFNNTTELNSTIYFCRANHSDFNYSSNPTYLTSSKIRVKENQTDAPVSYITTVGLYSADNELLAVAKLSEPLRKDPTNEMVLRVRLDY